MEQIIIDCDPGHDDAIALLLAVKSGKLKVLGVTTVAGNSELYNTTNNARRILDFAGAYDIGVYSGCEKPMEKELFRLTGVGIHGADGLGGPEIPPAVTPVKSQHAVDFLITELTESEEAVTLVCLGPLTNLATAMIKEPQICRKIKKIVIMGGAVREMGNVTSAAEFNIYVDPKAADVVFKSGCIIYLNSLDITMKAFFLEDEIERMKMKDDKTSVLVGELLAYFGASHISTFGMVICPVHDATCIAALLDEDLIQYELVNVQISTKDELTEGETVADIWNFTGAEKNCYLGVSIDREKFISMIEEIMPKKYVINQK